MALDVLFIGFIVGKHDDLVDLVHGGCLGNLAYKIGFKFKALCVIDDGRGDDDGDCESFLFLVVINHRNLNLLLCLKFVSCFSCLFSYDR